VKNAWAAGQSPPLLPKPVVAYLQCTNFTQQWAQEEEEHKTKLTIASLPTELQEHWQVFSEELAQWFPPSRNPDMTITFVKDAPSSINCKPYPKSPKEKEYERKWIKQ
jgi:hypothetical protein